MARFNPNTYDPAAESGSDDPAITDHAQFGKVVLLRQAAPQMCPCGCNSMPANKTSTFKMGHDARLKGILIRAHITQTPVIYVTGDTAKATSVNKPAIEWAAHYEWEGHLQDALERQAAKPATKRPAKAKAPLQVGDVRPVKVGRWSYLAKILAMNGTKVTVEYENASKVRKQATVALAAVGQ